MTKKRIRKEKHSAWKEGRHRWKNHRAGCLTPMWSRLRESLREEFRSGRGNKTSLKWNSANKTITDTHQPNCTTVHLKTNRDQLSGEVLDLLFAPQQSVLVYIHTNPEGPTKQQRCENALKVPFNLLQCCNERGTTGSKWNLIVRREASCRQTF